MRSFAHPGTEFELERSDTPPTVDGFAIGEYTGRVICLECGAAHHNIDEIPHDGYPDPCSQRFVHSSWYSDAMLSDR